VNQEVDQDIDRLVEDEVAKHLQTLIPTEMQKNVQEKKEELEKFRRQLHNSCVSVSYIISNWYEVDDRDVEKVEGQIRS